jgi:hypothetical protein
MRILDVSLVPELKLNVRKMNLLANSNPVALRPDARTKQVIAGLEADPSFPVDGTSMALKLITDGGPGL